MKITSPLFKPLSPVQFIVSNAIVSVLILVIFFNGAFHSLENFFIGLLWAFAIVITQWMGPIIIHTYLDKRIKWMDKPLTRTFIELISLIVWSVGAFIVVQSVMYYLIYGRSPAESWDSVSRSILYAFLIALFLSVFFTAMGFFKAWRRSVLKEAELKTEMMSYKYEALKNQINPHFLFNSFNVLSDLVYSDQEQAVKFIRQLSDLFQYVIKSRDKELVKLEEELKFLDSYVSLLKTRFGDKLKISIDSNLGSTKQGSSKQVSTLQGSTLKESTKQEPSGDPYIVPVTIQLLVENAVKHNEVSEKYPLEISIKREGSYLVVSNPVRPKQTGEISGKTGLKNIIQQYTYFTEREVEIRHGDKEFVVRIPLVEI